jgi:hypothetical protein
MRAIARNSVETFRDRYGVSDASRTGLLLAATADRLGRGCQLCAYSMGHGSCKRSKEGQRCPFRNILVSEKYLRSYAEGIDLHMAG